MLTTFLLIKSCCFHVLYVWKQAALSGLWLTDSLLKDSLVSCVWNQDVANEDDLDESSSLVVSACAYGTSQPVCYHVLWDENEFIADGLQTLTNNPCSCLCFFPTLWLIDSLDRCFRTACAIYFTALLSGTPSWALPRVEILHICVGFGIRLCLEPQTMLFDDSHGFFLIYCCFL